MRADSKAFASTTNDTQAASNDRIFYINDGRFNEDGRWTNWSRTPKDQEVSVGVLFKKKWSDYTSVYRKSSNSVL